MTVTSNIHVLKYNSIFDKQNFYKKKKIQQILKHKQCKFNSL